MPSPRDQLDSLLAAYTPRRIDASARGSGWNSVWIILSGDRPLILKVYGRRRSRIRERLIDLSHRFGGRTPYTAAARRQTEARCLHLWQSCGFDVPTLVTPPLDFPALPAPFLLQAFVPGPTLADALGDDAIPWADRRALWQRAVAAWGRRHEAALARREPALIQEHPGLDHLLVSGPRLVTFDMEVAYTGRATVPDRIAAELCGLVRSLFKRLPPEPAAALLDDLVAAYPVRARLEEIHPALFNHPAPLRRLGHRLDRRWLRKPGALDKYEAARRIQAALLRTPR